MSYRSFRLLLGGALAATIPLAGCTADPDPLPPTPSVAPAPAMRLVAFDSCDQLREDLRRAAAQAVGPWGLGDGGAIPEVMAGGARTTLDSSSAKAAAPASGTPYSGTNTHEQGVDEPDIVKTDGTRIVTVSNGVLRVVDAASRKETGRLDLGAGSYGDGQVLLSGDTALVLTTGGWMPAASGKRVDSMARTEPRLMLVRLTGTPTVISTFKTDGSLVDARQTGTTARVVVRSTPKIDFRVLPDGLDDKSRIRDNKAVVAGAPADAWLPDYEITTGTATVTGQVGCDRVSRPAEYSGASVVTVFSFDLGATTLGDGDPVSVVADGDTVYGTGSSLYIATDKRWLSDTWRDFAPKADEQRTDIYRFDTSGPGRPTYASAGSVPGWLLNQYALSEFDGALRVATTTDDAQEAVRPNEDAASSMPAPGVSASAIRVLREEGGSLVQVGAVEGLGKGERIYSVRFVGPRGYVVTFKQTDPLYSVDLADPRKPVVTGELKITGYSAHLQPAGDGRLIGIGQEADLRGRVQGTQVSYFDVADPRAPKRLAQHKVTDGQSEAEYDPHALLWWPATSLLVVPMTTFDPDGRAEPASSALALRVTDGGLTKVGAISQPTTTLERGLDTAPTIRRSLVVGDVLWTMSDVGLQASDMTTMKQLSWLPTA